MAHRLRMSAELGDWLAELCTSEPASAAEVAAALVSVMTADDPTVLTLVGAPAVDQIDPREELDELYQSVLEALQEVRRQAADAAWARAGAERLLAELDSEPQPDPAVQAWLRRARDKAKREEAGVTKRRERLQAEVDRFRTAKETAKAMYTAAEASLRIHDVVETVAAETVTVHRLVEPGDRPAQSEDDDLAELNRALEAAEANLQAVATEAYQTLRSLTVEAGQRPGHARSSTQPLAGLLELRADPLGRDVRLLLALQPADTVTLLAVLDGEDAIAEHQAQAIELAGGLLTDIRAGAWPPDDAISPGDREVAFADSATFLARFFPSDSDVIAERADALSAAQTLAGLRSSNGMSLSDLAGETGISEERLRFIEDGGLRAAEVQEAAAYVRALGGRLTLTARIGESDPVVLT
jgi:phage shock protein A